MKKELTLDLIARAPHLDRWLAGAVLVFAAVSTAGCSDDGTEEERESTESAVQGRRESASDTADGDRSTCPPSGYRGDTYCGGSGDQPGADESCPPSGYRGDTYCGGTADLPPAEEPCPPSGYRGDTYCGGTGDQPGTPDPSPCRGDAPCGGSSG